jgi:signal transduction histidine kinase
MALDALHRKSDRADRTVGSLLNVAQSGLARTKRLIDGLLEFARAGAHPDALSRANLGVVLDDVVTGMREVGEQAAIEISVEGDVDQTLFCSPGALTSVLSNLVGNAIKYMGASVERRITVRVDDEGDRTRISVIDTGPGLPPGVGQEVFEPYVRRGNTHQPGLGLGLALVARIVRAHGGEVGVLPATKSGCTFWVELPKAVETVGNEVVRASSHAVEHNTVLH